MVFVVVSWIRKVAEAKMGLTFIISKKLHSKQLPLQKRLHRTPTSHFEGSLVWRTSTVALERASRSRATPGKNPCWLHSSDEMHLAGKIANNKICKCVSSVPCVQNVWGSNGFIYYPGTEGFFRKKMRPLDTPFFTENNRMIFLYYFFKVLAFFL